VYRISNPFPFGKNRASQLVSHSACPAAGRCSHRPAGWVWEGKSVRRLGGLWASDCSLSTHQAWPGDCVLSVPGPAGMLQRGFRLGADVCRVTLFGCHDSAGGVHSEMRLDVFFKLACANYTKGFHDYFHTRIQWTLVKFTHPIAFLFLPPSLKNFFYFWFITH
jgi:hypothetical protein